MNVSVIVLTTRHQEMGSTLVNHRVLVFEVPDEKIASDWRRYLDQADRTNIDSAVLRHKFIDHLLMGRFATSYEKNVTHIYAFTDNDPE